MGQRDAYWRIFAEEVPSDLGLNLTSEQVDDLEAALVGAHENYGLGTGTDLLDAECRRREKVELQQQAMERVFRHIEECVRTIDRGPSGFFGAMNHDQKIAMHELFRARDFVKGATP